MGHTAAASTSWAGWTKAVCPQPHARLLPNWALVIQLIARSPLQTADSRPLAASLALRASVLRRVAALSAVWPPSADVAWALWSALQQREPPHAARATHVRFLLSRDKPLFLCVCVRDVLSNLTCLLIADPRLAAAVQRPHPRASTAQRQRERACVTHRTDTPTSIARDGARCSCSRWCRSAHSGTASAQSVRGSILPRVSRHACCAVGHGAVAQPATCPVAAVCLSIHRRRRRSSSSRHRDSPQAHRSMGCVPPDAGAAHCSDQTRHSDNTLDASHVRTHAHTYIVNRLTNLTYCFLLLLSCVVCVVFLGALHFEKSDRAARCALLEAVGALCAIWLKRGADIAVRSCMSLHLFDYVAFR